MLTTGGGALLIDHLSALALLLAAIVMTLLSPASNYWDCPTPERPFGFLDAGVSLQYFSRAEAYLHLCDIRTVKFVLDRRPTLPVSAFSCTFSILRFSGIRIVAEYPSTGLASLHFTLVHTLAEYFSSLLFLLSISVNCLRFKSGNLTYFLPKLSLWTQIHDVGHDGFTNSFHKHRLTARALTYNDQSIQVHCNLQCLCFSVM